MGIGKLICAVLGLWLTLTAVRSVRRGELTLRGGLDIRRRKDGAAFWATVALTLCLGVACLGVACLAIGGPLEPR